jgi:hypothetical protein
MSMLDRKHGALSIRGQCTLLGLARSGIYRAKPAANDNDLAMMRRLDELFVAHPFLGSRRMAAMLRAEGRPINRKRVQRLMRLMGIVALGPKPRTTRPAPGHKIYPYLLRGLVIDRPNQVWASDITYIPMARGFLYLVAIIDWTSRAVLAWRLSNTMDLTFCLDALEETRPLRQAGDLQQRPGCAVHEHSLHRPARGRGGPDLHGWAWPLARQCLHRAAVALAQIRGSLSQGLCRRWRGQNRHFQLVQLLQW